MIISDFREWRLKTEAIPNEIRETRRKCELHLTVKVAPSD